METYVSNQTVKLARIASGLSQTQAAGLLDISIPTYAAREKLPMSFTVDEMKILMDGFSVDGKALIRAFITDIFLA